MSGFLWLASYPKSGNTWLRLSLASLYADGAPVELASDRFAPVMTERPTIEGVLGVDTDNLGDDEVELLRPRVLECLAAGTPAPTLHKTHDAWVLTSAGEPLFPPALTRGAVYVVRDPRDVAVSLAHHASFAIERAVAMMADPEASLPAAGRPASQVCQRLLTWSGHVTSWLDAPGLAPLLVRYEDLHAEPAGTLLRVARYLPFPFSEDAVAGAVAATRFDTLRRQEERFGYPSKPSNSARFFRLGRAGAWRETLSPELIARIESDHGAVMRRLGYD